MVTNTLLAFAVAVVLLLSVLPCLASPNSIVQQEEFQPYVGGMWFGVPNVPPPPRPSDPKLAPESAASSNVAASKIQRFVSEQIEAGKVLSYKDKVGRGLALIAVVEGDAEALRMAIRAGADLGMAAPNDERTSFGTPLIAAASLNRRECMQLLLDAGADAPSSERLLRGSAVISPAGVGCW